MKRNRFLIFVTLILIAIVLTSNMDQDKGIQVGEKIPLFSLKDQNGKEFLVDHFIGKNAMVIYFYPKDDTPGCTKEACKFRDTYEDFENLDVKIIGISADDVQSHKRFAQKYNLPFTLLADTQNEVRNLFGVKNNIFGLMPGRVTYVIDKNGIVIHIYDNMLRAENHIDEALKVLLH